MSKGKVIAVSVGSTLGGVLLLAVAAVVALLIIEGEDLENGYRDVRVP